MTFLSKISLFTLTALALHACSIARPTPEPVPHPATDPTPQSRLAPSDEIRLRSAAPTLTPTSSLTSFDARLTNYPYPFPVRFFRLRTQGTTMQMAYMDEASATPNGKTVLLLHGKNFTSAYWGGTIRALLNEGYRVIAVDQIGFGRSTKPSRYQYSFATLADNTRRLLAALEVERVSVLGHSMGGMLAVRFALQNPEMVERVLLLNPIGMSEAPAAFTTLENRYSGELRQTANDLREYMQNNYFAGVWNPAYEELLEPQIGWMRGPDSRLVAWNRALTADMIATQPVVQDLPRLEKTTLFLIGQLDRTGGKDYPALARSAYRKSPNATLIPLPKAGHLPMVDAFGDYIREVLRFFGEI